MLLLCILVALYGFFQPYKCHVVNTLEIMVQFNFMVVLLLVSSGIMEPLYRLHPMKDVKEVTTDTDSCGTVQKNSVSIASWILVPLYYFPLLLLAIVCSSHIVRACRCVAYSAQDYTNDMNL